MQVMWFVPVMCFVTCFVFAFHSSYNDERHTRSNSDCQHGLLIVTLTYWNRDKTDAIFADHTFKLYFFYEKLWTLIKVSVKFARSNYHQSSLGLDNGLSSNRRQVISQPMMAYLLTYICVTPACARRLSTCTTRWQTCMLKGSNTTTIITYTINNNNPVVSYSLPLDWAF